MKLSRRLVAILIVLLIVVGGGAYLYFPRGQSVSAAFAATLSILNTDITAQRGGNGDFSAALDGDLYKTGDVVKSSVNGRAVLTFFDGSTLTVDPGSIVRVTTLNKLDNGGIQVSIEQTLGRSWASVQKLKTPDSKFEVKTPTSTAAVRGTSFETKVEQRPDGTLAVTYTADDGQLLVTAVAGGTTTVTPNTQVEIDNNQQAPGNPTPLPPQPTIRVTSSGGIGFTLIGPTGAQCGSTGNKAEIFGCLQSDNGVTIRNADAGHYGILMTAAANAPNANLVVDGLLGTTVASTRTLSKGLNLGDLVRSGFVYGLNPQSVGTFETPTLLTSICGAYGTGTIFSGGALQQRVDQLNAFAQANHNASVGFVATQAELNTEIQNQLAAQTGGAPVSNAKVAVDPAGLHFTANVSTPIGQFTASGDASMGPTPDGKLGLHINSLSAGPIPGAILDQVRSSIEQSALGVSDGLPFKVTQVKLASGCFAIMGTTR